MKMEYKVFEMGKDRAYIEAMYDLGTIYWEEYQRLLRARQEKGS